MEEILNELKIEVSDKNLSILQRLNETLLQGSKLSLDLNFSVLFDLLQLPINLEHRQQNVEVFKCIAEITKNTNQRSQFSSRVKLTKIMEFLKKYSKQELLECRESLQLLIQICRALGNIFHSNDEATSTIFQIDDGCIVSLLDLDLNVLADDPAGVQFATVRGGLLCNYLLGPDEICVKAIENQLISKIQRLIGNAKENELLHIVQALGIVEQATDVSFSPTLNELLIKTLILSPNSEVAENILELLSYQAENDDIKLQLAKAGLCDILFEQLQKHKELTKDIESARTLMKVSCDLIVLIVTGDEAMQYLYNTPMRKKFELWLDDSNLDLLCTGVLILGNFARTDQNCICIVQENLAIKKLLEILAKNNGPNDNARLQHSILGTLKNLVIPKDNKKIVIEAGLVDTIIPMLEVHLPPVVFKLLGTLRMTIDGQESLALQLLKNEGLINRLIEWSDSSDLSGCSSESMRLIAWLIKHGYKGKCGEKDGNSVDLEDLKTFIKVAGSLTNMLSSAHLIMQNESLISLSIICMIFNLKDQKEMNLDQSLIDCELGSKLSSFISKNSENMSIEIVENIQTFVKLLLSNSKIMKDHLAEWNIDEELKKVPSLKQYCTI